MSRQKIPRRVAARTKPPSLLIGLAPVVACSRQDVAQGCDRPSDRLHFLGADVATTACDAVDRLQQFHVVGSGPDDFGDGVVVDAAAADQMHHPFSRQSRHHTPPVGRASLPEPADMSEGAMLARVRPSRRRLILRMLMINSLLLYARSR